jgi:hypothetical protein
MKCEWVKYKYDVKPNEMICERCGRTALAPMPCGFKEAIAMMNAFAKIHNKCQERDQ